MESDVEHAAALLEEKAGSTCFEIVMVWPFCSPAIHLFSGV
jgi:hypothetical protein